VKKNRRTITLGVLVALLLAPAGFAASTAKPAQAISFIVRTVSDNPSPSCPKGYVFNVKTAKCDKVTVTNVTAAVAGKTVSANDMASAKVTILADDTVRGGIKVVQVHSTKCHLAKTFYNSGEDVSGHRFWFIDHNGVLCPSKASPTGWVKVSGGKTGRHCMNPAKEGPPPGKVIKGTVLLVKSFVNYSVHLRAAVAVEVHDTCGSAQASALATGTMSLSAFVRAKGDVDSGVFGSAIMSLSTSASAKISCSPPTTVTTTTPGTTTTTPTPPPTTTTVTTTTTTTTTPPPCTPAADRNQYNNCVSPCPPQEGRYTRSAQGSGYGFVDAGNGGYYSVWYNDTGNGFWGQSNQIPSGAVSGNAACYKPAPPAGGGPGGPPPSP